MQKQLAGQNEVSHGALTSDQQRSVSNGASLHGSAALQDGHTQAGSTLSKSSWSIGTEGAPSQAHTSEGYPLPQTGLNVAASKAQHDSEEDTGMDTRSGSDIMLQQAEVTQHVEHDRQQSELGVPDHTDLTLAEESADSQVEDAGHLTAPVPAIVVGNADTAAAAATVVGNADTAAAAAQLEPVQTPVQSTAQASHTSPAAAPSITDEGGDPHPAHGAPAHHTGQSTAQASHILPAAAPSGAHAGDDTEPAHGAPAHRAVQSTAQHGAASQPVHQEKVSANDQPTPLAARLSAVRLGDEQAPSSPIYGVATSSAFGSPDSAVSRSSSRDWLGHMFSGKKSSKKSSRQSGNGSISPTRLFEGLARVNSDAEGLFNSWHGPKANGA